MHWGSIAKQANFEQASEELIVQTTQEQFNF